MSRIDRIRFSAAIALLAGVAAAFAMTPRGGELKTAPAVVVDEAPIRVVSDTLRRGETLTELFARQGVNDVDWSIVAAAVRTFQPSRVRSGTVFNFSSRHGDSTPSAVFVRASYDTRLRLVRAADTGEWSPRIDSIAWREEPFLVAGVVTSSVSDAITGAVGDDVLPLESRIQLVWSLAEVYDWSLDFSRDVQPGDKFEVLAERMVSAEGEIRYGRILAARLDVGPRPQYAYRFDDPATGRPEFYDENGRSMRRELLRAPLEYRRISSGFSRSRFHPILRYSRPHQGIDFSAAYGAPIRSVGKGTVTYSGRMGGYGNLVEVRHNSTTTTRYAHLSRYGAGIQVGTRVEQGQTVGYVGASGLATSPHLHYELRINGRAVNPRRHFTTGPGASIAANRRSAFESERQRLQDLMEPGSATAPALATARVD